MKRVLVLGGTGMLGHVLWQELSGRADAWATVRGADLGAGAAVLDASRTLTGVDARRPESVEAALDEVGPQVVINAIGVVKQADAAADAVATIEINSLHPQRLAQACAARGVRMVHVSTDCVFSGRRGSYGEQDAPDPVDAYGRSKLLGEPDAAGCAVLRTSFIGRELGTQNGLLEWLVAQRRQVTGYAHARFSGLTARALARVIGDVALGDVHLEGLYHVAGEPISKHDLLRRLTDVLGLGLEVLRDETVRIDRTLDASRFREATGWTPPSWDAMLAELASGDHHRPTEVHARAG